MKHKMQHILSSTRFISTPAAVARTISYNKTNLITMVLTPENTIDWAIAAHPSAPAERLTALPLCHASVETFVGTWQQQHIGGAIVAWPVNNYGRCGADCGRVLWFLEQSWPFLPKPAPFCFHHWRQQSSNEYDDDAWGRNPVYGRTPPMGMDRHVVDHRPKGSELSNADSVWRSFQHSNGWAPPLRKTYPSRSNLLHRVP